MFKITLRSIRLSYGLTEEEVAGRCGINTHLYRSYEANSSLIPVKTLRSIRELFDVPLEMVLIGPDLECRK